MSSARRRKKSSSAGKAQNKRNRNPARHDIENLLASSSSKAFVKVVEDWRTANISWTKWELWIIYEIKRTKNIISAHRKRSLIKFK